MQSTTKVFFSMQTIYLQVAIVISILVFGDWPEWSCDFRVFVPNTKSHWLFLACTWQNGEWISGWWEKRRESRKKGCIWLSSPTPTAVQFYFWMQAGGLLICILLNTFFSAHSQSQFMEAQDHVARDSATIFPHVCTLSSFPCISFCDDETVSKLEQFLPWVIN